MKRFAICLFVIVVLSLAGAGYVAWQKITTLDMLTLNIAQPIEFEVKPGSNLYKVVEQLRDYGDIDELGVKLWLKVHPEFQNIQSGVYEIPVNSRFVDVVTMISNGTVKQFSITLIEGLTANQWLEALSSSEGLEHDLVEPSTLYSLLNISDESFCANAYASVEGCLLPDTYFYTKGTKSSEIIRRSHESMGKFVKEIWPSRFKDIPINTPYEALILASIIEKETAIESERSEIAGVFVNRLDKNMRLQTDPTVIYGIGKDFDGNITRKHLRTPTPYNTYVIKGLPITPIAMANKASIEAALFPALTDSLYFVATGTGGHQFSTNLADHNKALRRYLQQLKRNNADNNSSNRN